MSSFGSAFVPRLNYVGLALQYDAAPGWHVYIMQVRGGGWSYYVWFGDSPRYYSDHLYSSIENAIVRANGRVRKLRE